MKDSLFDLTGKVALVTGSSGGLGLAMAQGLGRAGAAVALNGRDEEKLAAAVSGFRDAGISAEGFAFDVTASDDIAAGVESIQRTLGPIDILINNVGIHRRAPLAELTEANWHEVIETNLTSAFLVAQRISRGMIERQCGKIINICSLMSEIGRNTTGNYAASKGGLKMLTKAMATEWACHNIQINGIGPGYFLTDMTTHLAKDAEFDSWVKRRTPAGRWGLPEDLIGVAVFLASAASSFVNGQIIYVDGGLLATV